MHHKLTVSSDRRWKWIHLKSSVQVALVMNFYKQVNFQDQSKGWIMHLCWIENFLQHKNGLECLKLVFIWRRKCAIEFLKQPILYHCFAHFHESLWKFPNFHSLNSSEALSSHGQMYWSKTMDSYDKPLITNIKN